MREPIPDKYFSQNKSYDARGIRFAWFFDRLPMQFKTSEALKLGEELEIPERTIKNWLSNDDNIERIGYGMYRKKKESYHD